MALEVMSYTDTNVLNVEILYHADFVGEAVTLDTTAFTDGVCKAGNAITKDGKKYSGSGDILGILLMDVSQARPQATVVISGHIKEAVAKANSGFEWTSTMKEAARLLVFH